MRGLAGGVAGVASGLAALLAVAGCGGGGHGPFRLTIAPIREQGLSYLLADGTRHELTTVEAAHDGTYDVATDERGRSATVVVRRGAGGTRVSVRLHPATRVVAVYDSFAAGANDHFLGGGEHGDFVDLRGRVVPIKVSERCSSAPIPFFASSAGWGVRLVSEHVAGLAFPGSSGGEGCTFDSAPQCSFPPLADRVEVCVLGPRLDEELYTGSFPQLLAAYESSAGLPAVPPRAELELVKWRDEVGGPGDVLEDVAKLRAAGVPLGWVLLDNPWETCVGTLAFDRRRIPDPAALVRRVHRLGVKFMLWVSPKDVCGSYPLRELVGVRGRWVLPLWRPQVARAFETRLRRAFAVGVDGVKGDRGDEVELGGRQNEYPLLFARAVLAALPHPQAALFRAATVGSQHVLPGIWAGDEDGDWSGLQAAIRLGATAAMSGFPTWGSDVGGYRSSGLTADVFARWAQLSAVSPVFEVGGAGPNSTPWQLGGEAMAALRAAAVLHYELFPYLYGLLERHQPVLRPLGYAFPADHASWQAEFELMVGPDLLAAPVVGAGTTPRVYLPPGRWVDLYSGRTVEGPLTFTRETPLAQFPLYARAGAVVPFDYRTDRPWWGLNELAHPGRAGYLASGGSGVDLHRQPHDVQLFVPAAARPRSVSFGGRPVAWSWQAGPFPGVVVRVHGPNVRGDVVLRG
ncbi:MAG TPA: TIM-barrel domain-containing protein [Gaiellaceae bacterium]|nr:TIM-barrel domain-containing protein [Gaiellaceae bacterium]